MDDGPFTFISSQVGSEKETPWRGLRSLDTTQLLTHKTGSGKGQDTGWKRRPLRPEDNLTVSPRKTRSQECVQLLLSPKRMDSPEPEARTFSRFDFIEKERQNTGRWVTFLSSKEIGSASGLHTQKIIPWATV